MAGSQAIPQPTAAIVLDHVTRRYRTADRKSVTAIDDVSLQITAGSVVAINGPSGSGKSTLLAIIGAQHRPDEGAIAADGRNLGALNARDLSAYRRQVGFVFQRFHLLPALTVLDNVIAPVLPFKTTFSKVQRGRELLAAVGLRGREAHSPAELSAGEQQRVAIARALINRPGLILADEPTGNLDARTSAATIDLLLHLGKRETATLIIATYDPTIASRCDRIIRIVDGSVRDDIDVHAASDPSATLTRLRRAAPH